MPDLTARTHHRRNALICLTVTVLTLGFGPQRISAALAEENPPSDEIEEIVITARKQAENLQEIPESITVFSASQIEDAHIHNIKDVANLTPNLNVSTNFRPGLSMITVRGLITPQVGEPPIAFVIDGVTVPSLDFINQGLFDIERIEILRGPQGALYGKNAVGGAINVITRQPSDELEGKIDAVYGNGNNLRIAGAVSGVLIDDIAYFRVGAHYNDFHGLIEDTFKDENVDTRTILSSHGQFRVKLFDSIALDVRGRYSDSQFGLGYYANVNRSSIDNFAIQSSQNVVTFEHNKLWEITSKLDHQSDFGALTLIGGYSSVRDINFFDGDFTALPADPAISFFPGAQYNLNDIEAWTGEIRFASPSDRMFRWLLGAFCQKRDTVVRFDLFADDVGTSLRDFDSFSRADVLHQIPDDQTSNSWALFGQANYQVTKRLEMTLALRYDEDRRTSFSFLDRSGTFARSTFGEIQPKASAAHRMTKDMLAYFTYSRGFRSGGFNEPSPLIKRTFAKETSNTFELGVKSSFADHRLILNNALFYTVLKGAQFTRFNPDSFTLENLNVDQTGVKGLEAELTARPLMRLELRLSVGVTDSKIKKFAGFEALQGNTMPYTAGYNASGSVQYVFPLGLGWPNVATRVAVYHLGERFFDLNNDFRTSPHTFLDADIGLQTAHWSFNFFVTNAFDERAPESVFSGIRTEAIRFPNVPRQYGINARYQWF